MGVGKEEKEIGEEAEWGEGRGEGGEMKGGAGGSMTWRLVWREEGKQAAYLLMLVVVVAAADDEGRLWSSSGLHSGESGVWQMCMHIHMRTTACVQGLRVRVCVHGAARAVMGRAEPRHGQCWAGEEREGSG